MRHPLVVIFIPYGSEFHKAALFETANPFLGSEPVAERFMGGTVRSSTMREEENHLLHPMKGGARLQGTLGGDLGPHQKEPRHLGF